MNSAADSVLCTRRAGQKISINGRSSAAAAPQWVLSSKREQCYVYSWCKKPSTDLIYDDPSIMVIMITMSDVFMLESTATVHVLNSVYRCIQVNRDMCTF